MTEKWLLTGGTGQVGMALRRSPPSGVEIFAPTREEFNLADLPDELAPLLDGVSAIVNCAAYTAVDKAEINNQLAEAINAKAPTILASAAAEARIPIIHVSTDYVFPADCRGPWVEDSITDPASCYGQTKLAGELAIQNSGARYAIVRTAWVVSADGSNFVKTMLRLGRKEAVINVVADQRGTPTHAGDLAAALATITQRFTNNRRQASGIWHCTNSGETTWHGLATYVFARAAEHGFKTPLAVRPINTNEYPTLARRPADSRLNCDRIASDFGITLRPWKSAVNEIIAALVKENKPA